MCAATPTRSSQRRGLGVGGKSAKKRAEPAAASHEAKVRIMRRKQQKALAISARMEGEEAVLRSIGKKRKVSEMELVTLCTFAQIGLLSVFSGLDDQVGRDASKQYESLIEHVRVEFGSAGDPNGLNRLATSLAAILGGERLGRYVAAPQVDERNSEEPT